MSAFTAKNDLFGRAPKRRVLKGDKTKAVESAQHIIEFPGGAIELSRTDDGDYWAHIIVNRAWALDEIDGMKGAIGEVVESRIDWHGRQSRPIPEVPEAKELTQIAVLIRPLRLKP